MNVSLYYGLVSVQTRNERILVQPVVEIRTSLLSGTILRQDAIVLAELLRIAIKAEGEAAQSKALEGGAS